MEILNREGLQKLAAEAANGKKKLQAYGTLLEPEIVLVNTMTIDTMIDRIVEHQEHNKIAPTVVASKADLQLPEDPEKPAKGEKKLFPWGKRFDLGTGKELVGEDMFRCVVFSANPNDKLPIDGGVNGTPYRIKQGAEVTIPRSIYESLQNAKVVTTKQDITKPDPNMPGSYLTTEDVRPQYIVQVFEIIPGKKVA
jgi:hypothetical protein